MASQEWYSPPWILNLALAYLGRIDLDPCANPQKTVPAIRHYVGSQGQDGLALPWGEQRLEYANGTPCEVWAKPFTLFLNPPWGSIDPWADRLISEADHFSDALMLVPVRTERPWFQVLKDLPVWFPNERVNYLQEQDDGSLKLIKGISTNSCIFVQHAKLERFEQIFGPYGRIYTCTQKGIAA